MAEAESIAQHADHPAPARHEVNLALLAFGIVGAPTVWAVHFLANVTIASRFCQASANRAAPPHLSLLAIDALAGIVALGALFVSLQAWRATRHENADTQSQGSSAEHHAAEVGEGRTRFVALGGIMMSLVFFVAILFDTVAALVVTACGK